MAEATEKSEITYKAPKSKKASEWQGAFSAYQTAFDRIKKNSVPAFLFIGTYALLAIVSGLAQSDIAYTDPNYQSFEDVTYLIFLLALPIYGLALADNKKISINQFMELHLRKYLLILAAGILYILIVGASLLLLIIPAIWTIAWFYFQSYIIADKGIGPIAALKESKRLATKHKGKVWGIIGVSVLVGFLAGMIASVIPYIGGVASAIASVWVVGASAILYRWLQQNHTA